MGWLLKQNPDDIQLYFTITLSLIGCLCLFPRHPFYFVFAKIRDGIVIDTRWVYHSEPRGGGLLGEIAIGSVGSIVVSRGLQD